MQVSPRSYGMRNHLAQLGISTLSVSDHGTGIYQEDQGLEVDQHQPSPYLSMQHAPVYVQKSSPNVSHTSGHFVRDLEPEDFYGSQTSYTKSSFARPSNKNKRLSTSTIAHPATPSRTLAHHHQVLQEVPSDRSAVPVDIIARRAFQAARAKGNDQEDYRGERLADDTDELGQCAWCAVHNS